MYLHVFPNLSAASTSAAAASATPAAAGEQRHEDQIINCDIKDFEGEILRRHCSTWLQRRRCLDILESLDSKLQSIEDKMVRKLPRAHVHLLRSFPPLRWLNLLIFIPVHSQCKSQLLSEQEQQLYGETDRELLQQKIKTTVAAMRTLVQNNNIDTNAKAHLLAQVNAWLERMKQCD